MAVGEKSMYNKKIGLSDQEIKDIHVLSEKLCESDGKIDKALEEQFGEQAADVRSELQKGINQFYDLLAKKDENTLRFLLEKNMESMSTKEKYVYLTNLTISLTLVCSHIIEGENWKELDDIKDQANVYLEKNNLSEEDIKYMEEEIESLLDNITEQSDAFSVLMMAEPRYQELLDACQIESPDKIEAMAMNTKNFAVSTAAALYILNEQGKLPSLGGQKIKPRDIGVIIASALEIDAAYKMGPWEKVKEIIQKVLKVTTSLLIASPNLLVIASKPLTILAFVGILGILPKFWILIAGVILLGALVVNAKMLSDQVQNSVPVLFEKMAYGVNVTLDKVKMVCDKVGEWFNENVLPEIIDIWNKIKQFVTQHIIVPVVRTASGLKTKVSNQIKSIQNATVVEEVQEEDERHDYVPTIYDKDIIIV